MLDHAQRDLLDKVRHGVLTTLKRDGTPQMSIVGFAYDDQDRLIRISVTDSRAKTRNLRRDPRASLLVTPPSMRGYVVLEGTAELTPVARQPDDATVDELVDLYRTIAGEHPDWAEFRQAMVDERRLVLRIAVSHTYGWLA
ncbi:MULTISPECIES: PPOX class F420-dependent oxidoreductase [Thermocrispum]|jgi:PPOX class probable F420-dependent enzyme|uniref:PPOX class F420-dependent oxidoreductase n=1 Tax=Thermocrispum agreste TaxID=37925 RepID=A0A2W4J727_9PSEU|nr:MULTISPECIES: PPOX class F420-dependent oxidoreductase [Thermocrispum]PZM93978.1 MAG: PPOX class F420-dependent oxidoreductase [Thermocrispum agreste]